MVVGVCTVGVGLSRSLLTGGSQMRQPRQSSPSQPDVLQSGLHRSQVVDGECLHLEVIAGGCSVSRGFWSVLQELSFLMAILTLSLEAKVMAFAWAAEVFPKANFPLTLALLVLAPSLCCPGLFCCCVCAAVGSAVLSG